MSALIEELQWCLDQGFSGPRTQKAIAAAISRIRELERAAQAGEVVAASAIVEAYELARAEWERTGGYLGDLVAKHIGSMLVPRAAAIPEGYVLVPKEPTLEMRHKAADAYLGAHGYGDAWIRVVYASMIAAAPRLREGE